VSHNGTHHSCYEEVAVITSYTEGYFPKKQAKGLPKPAKIIIARQRVLALRKKREAALGDHDSLLKEGHITSARGNSFKGKG
jgi:hypothetical protein